MEISEDETIQKYAKQRKNCMRKFLLPLENGWSCIFCKYSVMKRKNELSKTSRKKIILTNRLKYAQDNYFCICIDVKKNTKVMVSK